MLKAVAFDMDDTLLSINLSAFIAVFACAMAALGRLFIWIVGA